MLICAVCEIKTGILTALVFVDQKTADQTVHSDRKHRLSQSKKIETQLDIREDVACN